ncbi:MAG: GDSL-type esterase/lipase family protein [Candidatus Aminicenantes bacterium]|nr:GDSL-type esterase/lipase family protein [Candidatus Aminicenantes bacterium]
MNHMKFETAIFLFFLWAVVILLSGPLQAEICPPVKQVESRKQAPTIAIMGSSLAAGWVTSRDEKFDMNNGWAFRLERYLKPKGFHVINISLPGDTTEKVLERLEKDLFPLNADIVIISLSLENEGIRGLWEKTPTEVYEGFKDNLKTIVKKCLQKGIRPVVASCYASDNYTEDWHYDLIRKMNLELARWDVPGINLLGALNDGKGRFVQGITFDLDHPDSTGHRELFYSVVPGLFESMIKGIPLPRKAPMNGFFAVEHGKKSTPLSYIPDSLIHSFSMQFETRIKEPGTVAAFIQFNGGVSQLVFLGEDRFQYISAAGASFAFNVRTAEHEWQAVCVSHRFIQGEILIYVNGDLAARIEEAFIPLQFVLGGSAEDIRPFVSAGADYREWMIYRTALNADEVASLHQGVLLQPSLELYIPLSGVSDERDRTIKNFAQNTTRAYVYPSVANRDEAPLRDQIQRETTSEKIFVDPDAKKPIDVDLSTLEKLQGVYEMDSQMTITIVLEGRRLFALINEGKEGKSELFPLSPLRFFMKIVGPEMEMEFKQPGDGDQMEIMLQIGPNQMKAKRVRLR